MTDAEAEIEADRLLAEHRCLGRKHGCYTDEQIARRSYRRGDTELDENRTYSWAITSIEGIANRTICKSLQQHKCPGRAVECVRLWLMQYTYREIAVMKHIKVHERTVRRYVALGLKILRQDDNLGVIEMLASVFHLPPGVVAGILSARQK